MLLVSASYRLFTCALCGMLTAAVVAVCSFTYRSSTAMNGTFTTPNYPGLYPRNTECHYIFYGVDRQKVYVRFIFFDVEGIPPG